MADHEGRDLETPAAEASEPDGYELDLDKHSASDLEAAIQEAVEAVDRVEPEEAEGLSDEVAALRERLVRTLADFDNYRKRADREKETLRRLGTFDVVKDFLGVIDNLERALEASGSVEDLKKGVALTLRQQEEVLRRHGVERIESVGRPFDPTIHEAVGHQQTDEVDEPTVAIELQKGYLLYDRLLRPAMVHVAMPARAAAAPVEKTGPETDSGDGDEEAASEETEEMVGND